MNNQYRICSRCIMDTTDVEIQFDENGVCNHCNRIELIKSVASLSDEQKQKKLSELVAQIKEKGKGKKYDCVIGVSGGVDSTFVAYKVKELGLRPLAVHLDNGWNSELSVSNIEKVLKKLEIDLYTLVLDWGMFKDLQLSFLKASTPDAEIPSDHAIVASLYKIATEQNIQYILIGTNFNTEAIMPRTWAQGHRDWKYIKSVHRKFGKASLKNYPHYSLIKLFYYKKIRSIKEVSFLNYIDYSKKEAIEIIEKKLGWKYYGDKHFESIYTRFFQGYILTQKFNMDKRKPHLSSLINSGEITREDALAELKKETYSKELQEEDKQFVIKKFNLTEPGFNQIMNLPLKSFWDYPSYHRSWLYKVAKVLGTLPSSKIKLH